MQRVKEIAKQKSGAVIKLTRKKSGDLGSTLARKSSTIRSKLSSKRHNKGGLRKQSFGDELEEIKHLKGKERLVAFFEKFDREEADQVDVLMQYGGMTDSELWNHVQVKYGVNRELRLWNALKICEPYQNVAHLLAKHRGHEEQLIAQKVCLARQCIEARQAEDSGQTWTAGDKNSYQGLPGFELGD
jgi:hypothetical protein